MVTFMTKFMSKKVRNFIRQTPRGVLRKEIQGYSHVFLPITSSRRASPATTRIPVERTHTVSRANVAQSQGEERAVHVAA